MMLLKTGVSLQDLRPQLVLAILAGERIWAPHDLVVTSANDGKHGTGSFHSMGLAVDLRTKNLPPAIRAGKVAELRAALGAEFDVIFEAVGTENEHCHVEWDPPARNRTGNRTGSGSMVI